jgi:hypothetical protein
MLIDDTTESPTQVFYAKNPTDKDKPIKAELQVIDPTSGAVTSTRKLTCTFTP